MNGKGDYALATDATDTTTATATAATTGTTNADADIGVSACVGRRVTGVSPLWALPTRLDASMIAAYRYVTAQRLQTTTSKKSGE